MTILTKNKKNITTLKEAVPLSRLMSGAMGFEPTPLSTSGVLTNPAPNPVLMLLNSRLEPKIVSIKDKTMLDGYSASTIMSMHTAGGYEHINLTRRNWITIAQQMKQLVLNNEMKEDDGVQDTTSTSTTMIKDCEWPMKWDEYS